MGYVPPQKDIEAIIYGNQLKKRVPPIRKTEKVAKGKFHDLIQQYKQEGHFVERNGQLYHKKKQVESQLTKKGTFFDEYA